MSRSSKLIAVTLVSALTFAIGGCVSSGNPSVHDDVAVSKIKIGETTKDEVRTLLGKPNSTTRSSGSMFVGAGLPVTPNVNYEIWNYTHISVETDAATFIPIVGLFAGGASSRVSSLTVTFDDQGIVRAIRTSDTEGRSGMGAGSSNPKTNNQKTQSALPNP